MRDLPRRVFQFYWGQGIADDVPALTYYLVLSLAPFALGLAAIEALLLNDVVGAIEVADQVNRFLPEAVHGDIRRLVIGTRDNSPLLLLLAVVAMLWTTSGAIGVIERCESRMLDCSRHDVVTGRLRNVLLGAGVAVMVGLAAASAPVIGDAADVDADDRGNGLDRDAGFAAAKIFLLLAVVLFGLYAMALVMLIGAGVAVGAELRIRGARAAPRPMPGAPEGLGLGADPALRSPRAG